MSRFAVAALSASVLITFSPAACAAEKVSPESTFSAGIGVAVVPKYFGSDEHRATPVLDLSYAHKSGFFVSTQDGIGMRTEAGPLTVSAALGFDSGRKERNTNLRFGSKALKGMGDIRSSALANLSVGYDFGFMTVGVEAELALTHRERGNRLEIAAGVPLLADAKDNVSLFASINVADRKNMQTYYGVTALQSQRSGYRQYTAKAGVEKVGLGVSWNHQLNDKWSVRTMAGAFRLVGDAADSPLTKRKTAPVVFTTLNYKF